MIPRGTPFFSCIRTFHSEEVSGCGKIGYFGLKMVKVFNKQATPTPPPHTPTMNFKGYPLDNHRDLKVVPEYVPPWPLGISLSPPGEGPYGLTLLVKSICFYPLHLI